MVLKRKIYTSKEYIQIGMAFFLIAIASNMVGDGKIIGAYFARLIQDQFILATIQGIATGISIPLSCASIFFNMSGLIMMRSRC